MSQRFSRKGLAAAAAVSLAALFGPALFAGCEGFDPVVTCGVIPSGGCPVGRGGTCDDVECDALYDCTDGKWVETERCSHPDGGADDAGADGGREGGTTLLDSGSDACTPIVFDHKDEVMNCVDLQPPDCPAGAIEFACAEQACATIDCLDFYLCKSTGWDPVAHCTDDGTFVDSP